MVELAGLCGCYDSAALDLLVEVLSAVEQRPDFAGDAWEKVKQAISVHPDHAVALLQLWADAVGLTEHGT